MDITTSKKAKIWSCTAILFTLLFWGLISYGIIDDSNGQTKPIMPLILLVIGIVFGANVLIFVDRMTLKLSLNRGSLTIGSLLRKTKTTQTRGIKSAFLTTHSNRQALIFLLGEAKAQYIRVPLSFFNPSDCQKLKDFALSLDFTEEQQNNAREEMLRTDFCQWVLYKMLLKFVLLFGVVGYFIFVLLH